MSEATLSNPVDLRGFAGRFPTGVAVITTRDAQGKCHGITMSALTSLSMDPPLFLICLNNTSKTLAAIHSSDRLCINFLSAKQIEVCKIFASKSDDKFSTVPFTMGELDTPMIDDAVAHAECTVQTCHDGGDHTIVIARVDTTVINDAEPLVYHAGKFTALAQH